MLYISEDKRNKTQTINLTRGDDAVLEVSLKNINSEDFTLGKSDYLIFDVRVLPRKESKLLLHIESAPGSNRIVFRHDDTASLNIGEYSAEVQMMTAVSGQSITVDVSGIYEVSWTGFRSSTGGTNGSQLYIGVRVG